MSVWVVRHPRVVADHTRCYGRFNLPLAATFAAEVAAIQKQLPWVPEVVWTAPSMRCQRAALALDAVVQVDERLAELDFGDWEGKPWASIQGPEFLAWTEDPWSRRPPRGEAGKELEARVEEIREEIRAQAKRQRIVVVTHDGVMRVWRRLTEGFSRAKAEEWSVPCGTVWELD